MNYFEQTGYISNSDLSNLKELFRLEEEKDLTRVYQFGSLFHGMITEPHKVDHEAQELIEGQKRVQFSKEAFARSKAMYESAIEDKTIKILLESCSLEHEIYRKQFKIEYQGHEIFMPTRCKLDFLNKRLSIGADLKGIKVDNQKQFTDAILFFDYDRQGSWYMDHANLDQFMFIGTSKTKNKRTGKHEVFKFAMKRGDPNYESGKRKYSHLAFYYYHLIYNLNLPNPDGIEPF